MKYAKGRTIRKLTEAQWGKTKKSCKGKQTKNHAKRKAKKIVALKFHTKKLCKLKIPSPVTFLVVRA